MDKKSKRELKNVFLGSYMKEVTLNNGKKYYFNRFVFLMSVVVLLLIALITLGLSGFDKTEKIYIACGNDQVQCDNPLYKNWAYCGKSIDANSQICSQEFLPGGFEYGQKPPLVVQYFASIAIALLFLAFLVNHFAFNRHLGKKDFKEVMKEVKLDGGDGSDNGSNK
jgi:hypothetical protein